MFDGVAAQVSRSAVRHTMLGAFASENPMEVIHTDIGDGIVVDGSSVDVTDTLVQDCARAGVLFNASWGNLSGVSSQNNQFGLVIQGSSQPSHAGAGNVYKPNLKENVVIGGNLPVPNEALPVPGSPPPPPTP